MKIILIKLFIGLVLFGTLAALTVLNVPHAEKLTDLCYVALIGLGITHLGASTSDGPKEGGFASVPLLAAMGLFAALMLSACTTATTTQKDTSIAYTRACAAYGGAFDVALQMRIAGKLNQSQIDQVTLLDSQITPICTGPLPVDTVGATQQVVNAVTIITALEVLKP